MKTSRTRQIFLFLFVLFVGIAMPLADAEAKRLGGGRSVGRQSSNVTQREAAPQQQYQSPSRQQGAPAQQAQPSRNRWLGPLAGIAAGIGIASLLSHFGMGAGLAEGIGSMLMIGLVVMAGIFLFRMFRNSKNAAGPQPAYAGAQQRAAEPAWNAPRRDETVAPLRRESLDSHVGASTASGPVSVTGQPLASLSSAAPGSTATWTIPADFDVDAFLRSAKVYFVRLQAAWDAADLADLREFTTPEMFAEIKVDLTERGAAKNQTDVVNVDAQMLGIEEQGSMALASVRFTGSLREAPDAAAEPFAEVWNLVKPLSGRDGWLLAGIQQEPAK
jgi:predicted lipid-binding transport protein (Tim44 family)